MESTEFIDVLRKTRDADVTILDSYNSRNCELEFFTHTNILDINVNRLLWILMMAAQNKEILSANIYFDYSPDTTVEQLETILHRLCDELERDGFNTDFVAWDYEQDDVCAMNIPLFTSQDEEVFIQQGALPPWSRGGNETNITIN